MYGNVSHQARAAAAVPCVPGGVRAAYLHGEHHELGHPDDKLTRDIADGFRLSGHDTVECLQSKVKKVCNDHTVATGLGTHKEKKV